MKKIIILSCILFLSVYLFAQISVGINGEMIFRKFELIDDNLPPYSETTLFVGGELQCGYLYKNRWDFNASISHTILVEGHRYNTFKTNMYMYLLQKRIKPYIGITSGFALIRREGYDWHTFDKEALLGPSIGLLFESFVINNLFTNIEFNYHWIFTMEKPIYLHYIPFKIGAKYIFNYQHSAN